MSLAERLMAAASPKLAKWLDGVVVGANVTHPRREIVDIRVKSAAGRVAARVSTLYKLADAWVETQESANMTRIDWSLIGDGELRYLWEDLKDNNERATTYIPFTDDQVVELLRVWVEKQKAAVPDGISIWTDAPKDYDHGYTFRTRETASPRVMAGKTLTRVIIPSGSVSYQVNRYMSGGHVGFDERRMAEEAKHDEKAGRRDTWSGEVGRLRRGIAECADLIPAAKADGTWRIGGRVDYATHRPVTLPPAAPSIAQAELKRLQTAFYALPKEARDDEWRVGGDIDELLQVAARAVERERIAKQTADQELKKMNDAIAKIAKAAEPGWVLVRTKFRSGGYGRGGTNEPEYVYGRVTKWPTNKYSSIETPRGHVPWTEDLEAMEDPNAATGGTPADVWVAGAPISVKAKPYAGRMLYGWKPAYSPMRVVNDEGKTQSVSSKAYRAYEQEASGTGAGQDRILDAALTELTTQSYLPGWNVATTVFDGGTMLVEFHPPATKGRGFEGWQVRKRMVTKRNRDGYSIGYLVFTRQGKMHPKDRNYWRHPENLEHGVQPVEAFDNYFRGFTEEEQKVRADWLAEDPRRTLMDARNHDWNAGTPSLRGAPKKLNKHEALTPIDAALRAYGAYLDADGYVVNGAKPTSIKVRISGNKLVIEGNGKKLATGPIAPSTVENFVEKFWLWEKR